MKPTEKDKEDRKNFGFEDTLKVKTDESITQLLFEYQEMERKHNPYDREHREMESIRTGDLASLKESMEESFDGEYAVLSKNPLRSTKNLAIFALAISSRAAIEGGVPFEEAYTVSDGYILKVDEAISNEMIGTIVTTAKYDFAGRVKANRGRNNRNPVTEKCKRLVFMRMHQKILVRDLAEELGITPEYLSVCFKKEVGMTLSRYIHEEKVKSARALLIYSDYDIDEIANYLGYSSQSHFGKLFKDSQGLSPGEFRRRFKKWISRQEKID